MTLTKARQLLEVQVSFGGGYNRNAAQLILTEVAREHGQDAADALIREMCLADRFGIQPAGSSRSTSPTGPTQSE
jgi:hypothetical protein